MKIKIASRLSGAVLFEHDVADNTLRITLEAAVRARAHLEGAHLVGAHLAGAHLGAAHLEGAHLAGACLAGAHLAGAYLAGANLDGAYLAGANLEGAHLEGAHLEGAHLAGAYLAGANLDGAYLDGEVLNKAPISLINLQWSILITGQYMRIGCKRHTHEEWRDFTDAKIRNMAKGALAFWRKWKAPLLAICQANHEAPAATKKLAA